MTSNLRVARALLAVTTTQEKTLSLLDELLHKIAPDDARLSAMLDEAEDAWVAQIEAINGLTE